MYVIVLLLCCLIGFSQGDARSSKIIKALQLKYYDPLLTGLWINWCPLLEPDCVPFIGWWNSANSLEALIEYTKYSGDTSYKWVIGNVFLHTTLAQTKNGYYDDAQWWGIAWVRAYELTGEVKYLDRAKAIFEYIITEAWDSTCGGGLWWSNAKNYKNAITNELFLVFSTLLYSSDGSNPKYSQWAIDEWNWFKNSGMINGQNLINDGLTNTCQNNGQTTWTYNQGVILGGLANLAEITGDTTMITTATNIAKATIAINSPLVYQNRGALNGVLKEPCEDNDDHNNNFCNSDQDQFKGIFVRYLGILTKKLLDPTDKTDFINWISLNANSIWNNDKNGKNLCGLSWVGPNNQEGINSITQTSALDCFNAEELVSS